MVEAPDRFRLGWGTKNLKWDILYMEKATAPHSTTLAWKIPRTEEPIRLQSMGSRRVRHDWASSLSLFTLMHWRRKWQPTPVFLPGESQGRGSLVCCRLWGRTSSSSLLKKTLLFILTSSSKIYQKFTSLISICQLWNWTRTKIYGYVPRPLHKKQWDEMFQKSELLSLSAEVKMILIW